MPAVKIKTTAPKYHFLSGGGEMGALMRAKDWSKNTVGPVANWPQSLRTTLGIILNSKFPMFLWWGPQLICFYNDAYRPSLGQNGKHPGILGMPAKHAWIEIWDIIKPLIDQVLAGGEATWNEDQLIPIYRNGKIEDVYWTFSYSPVRDESGDVGGVLVTCNETTQKVTMLNELREREAQLNFTINAAELGTWDLNPITNKFVGNERLKEWFGLPPGSEIELPVALNNISDQDRRRVIDSIHDALQPGSDGNYEIEYTIVNPLAKQERRVLAKGKALFNEHNIAWRFSGTLQDITQRYLSAHKLEETEKRFRDTVKQAPVGITIFRGPDFMVDMANEAYLQVVGRTESEFVGKPLFEALPEVKEAVADLLKGVYETGISYYGTEFPVTLNRYGKEEQAFFNFVYHPLREENDTIYGIIVIATEVTTSVRLKHSLTESEKQFRNLVMQSPIPMAIFRGENNVIELANTEMIEEIWRKKKSDVLGKKILDVFPELKEQKYPELLHRVYTTGKPHWENESVAYVQYDEGLQKFYLDFEYAPLFETDGKVSGIIVTVNDVTERVEARQKVEDAKERLRLAVEATELATWELDLKTHDIIYSPRLLEIFGHPATEILTHKEMRSQIHPGDIRAVVEAAFAEALKTGIYVYEARVIKPNSKICWIKTQGKVFYDNDQKPLKIVGTLRDVTEEKQHRQELEESEERFRLLSDSMPQFIWTGDENGNLNYFNQSVYEYSGLTPEQVKKDGWMQIVHPDDRERNVKEWIHSVSTGKDFLSEHRFRRHDGEYRWQLSRAVPHRDASGNIQMWVGTSTDIQEMKEQEQQKDFFISMASHELKTPITTIKGYVQIMQEMYSNKEDAFLNNSLKTVDRQIVKLTNLIGDMLDISKIKSGSLELNKEHFQINELIPEVIDEIRHINPGFDITFTKEKEVTVFADRERIGQVLINFLTNAVKYSPKAGKIKVKSCINQDKILISVEDFGIGINKAEQERIFERFYRVEGKSEKTFPGFGIGLYIALEIINRHNGEIGVRSESGKGSVFYFSLPLNYTS